MAEKVLIFILYPCSFFPFWLISHQCYGVEAASLYYFGKHASDLAPEEAAILIGISNSPSAYDPVAHPDASKEKRNDVLDSMKEVGYLSEEDYEKQ